MVLNTGENKLLDKFNLSLSSLDYRYIERCRNIKELENILRVLRSGEEGIYPDLIKFCENRLRELSPSNKLLQFQKRITSIEDLPPTERHTLNKELMEWEKQRRLLEHETKALIQQLAKRLPPVRPSSEIKKNDTNKQTSDTTIPEQNRSKLKTKAKCLSYDEWDKLNVEKELEKLDSTKDNKAVHRSNCEIYLEFDYLIDTTGMDQGDRLTIAEREKMKGNEAFKVKDYERAAMYYSRSISSYPTAAAINNKAFANYKLKNYAAALIGLDAVLKTNAHNVKALYRRGLVYKQTGRLQLAYMDFSNLLELEPDNKAAKDQLQELLWNPGLRKFRKSVLIEEVSNEDATSGSDVSVENMSVPQSSEVQREISRKSQHEKKFEESKLSIPKHCEIESDLNNQTQCAIEEICEQCAAERSSKTDEAVLVKIEPIINQPAASRDRDQSQYLCSPTNPSDTKISEPASCEKSEPSKTVRDEIYSGPKDSGTVASYSLPKITNLRQKKSFEMLKGEITPFKFLTLWHNLDANGDGEAAAMILNRVGPKQLSVLLTNKLDSDLLCGIIRGITSIVNSGDGRNGYEFLLHLLEVPRVAMVLSFLSVSEQKEIQHLFAILKEAGIEDSRNLEEKFNMLLKV